MTNADLLKAKEVMESYGFTIVMPGLMTHTGGQSDSPTIERPATQDAEMEAALASVTPGGDLAMASHAGLALAIGDLQNRVVLLENGMANAINQLAEAGMFTREPIKVESEPDPIPPSAEADPEVGLVDAGPDEEVEPAHWRVERAADGLPKLSDPDPASKCDCGHTRLQHNSMEYACHAPGKHGPTCDCKRFHEDTGLISL